MQLASGIAYAYPEATWRAARTLDDGGQCPWDLSRRQLRLLAPGMANLPVLVEHDPSRVVGRVRRAAVDDVSGGLAVELELGDAIGDRRQLSLRHDCGQGVIWPVEVSVVRQGARSGCHLYKGEALENVLSRMATDPVHPPESMSEPVLPANDDVPMNNAQLLESVTAEMDPEKATRFVKMFEEITKSKMAAQDEASALRRQVEQLNQQGAKEFESALLSLRKKLPESAPLEEDIANALLAAIGAHPEVRGPVQTLVSACASALTAAPAAPRKRPREDAGVGLPPAPKTNEATRGCPSWLAAELNLVKTSGMVHASDLGDHVARLAERGA